MNINTVLLLVGLASPTTVSAATLITIKSASLGGVVLRDGDGVPLDAGGPGVGDGDLIEVGYYSLATDVLPFAGEWTALTGPQSASLLITTIGDGLLMDGTYSFAVGLFSDLPGLPSEGTPLAIKYYDAATRAAASAFNVVAKDDGSWNWTTSGSQINMLVGAQLGTVWQGGSSSAYQTTIAVPEASVFVMLVSGAVAMGLVRRYRSRSDLVVIG